MQLSWHKYKYYPYERELAVREVESLLSPRAIREDDCIVLVDKPANPAAAHRLVYFATTSANGTDLKHTQQSQLERINGNGPNRQSTRYSVHGLHEYKGKFNPQIAKALLNIFGAVPGQRALDPFCGSGTSLVECAHLGLTAVGIDINPMAAVLANAKLKALGIPAKSIRLVAKGALRAARKAKPVLSADERAGYLQLWFSKDVLRDIERLKLVLDDVDEGPRAVLFAIASNLLRDYSMQEPKDLRIRRRSSPLPATAFFDAFEAATAVCCTRLEDAQTTLGVRRNKSKALLADCRDLSAAQGLRKGTLFDLALTSPPYATALPYIDTQRLSLVWLGLISPSEILALEARLVGSREIRGQSKKELLRSLEANASQLPKAELDYCISLQRALGDADGFRRQAMPALLYRYFSDMARTFESVRSCMKDEAPFGLIVGGNHTILSGKRFDINTPKHLANLAVSRGWKLAEMVELQTYQRYGLHAYNATNTESLVILRA